MAVPLINILSTRTFGVELEACVTCGDNQVRRSFNKLADSIAEGRIACAVELGYHEYRPKLPDGCFPTEGPPRLWTITEDGSVSIKPRDFRYSRERQENPHQKRHNFVDIYHGMEIISPVLTVNDFPALESVMGYMTTKPFRVLHNASTSTHVHVGIEDPEHEVVSAAEYLVHIKKVAAIWFIFETFINFHFPAYRVNHFCRRSRRTPLAKSSTQTHFLDTIRRCRLSGVQQLMNHTGIRRKKPLLLDQSRNFAANFDNANNMGMTKWTIEFRIHEGSVKMEDIENWCNVLMSLFDAAILLNWETIRHLARVTDALSDKKAYDEEPLRNQASWEGWLEEMHTLFVNLLAGEHLRDKHLGIHHDVPPQHLEQQICNLQEMTPEEEASATNDEREVRATELFIQKSAQWLRKRRAKWKATHLRMIPKWDEWDSESDRSSSPTDFTDFPNSSGLVLDSSGMDIEINENPPSPGNERSNSPMGEWDL